ncbi:type II toxin-antitoxin system RelE/ParE family toxin [candidate division KSB1 bacterium]
MPKQIIWSPLSEEDFDSILKYLQNNWDDKIAQKFIEIIEVIIEQISINPKQFPIIHQRLKIRKCVITKHNTLYYREMKEHVDVLRIFDNRQNPKKLKF